MTHSPNDLAVAEKLGELKATSENTHRAVDEMKLAFTSRLLPLEARVTDLEAWRYRIIGGAGVLAYVAQYLPKPF